MVNIYENVDRNKWMSVLVVSCFIAFVVGVTYVFARGMGFDLSIVGIALIFSGIMSFASYYFSDSIILSLSGAREANRKQNFQFTL